MTADTPDTNDEKLTMETEPVTLNELEQRPDDKEIDEFEKTLDKKVTKSKTKKKTKNDIIADIERLKPGKFAKRTLNRMKKADLEICLCDLLEEAVSQCQSIPEVEELNDMPLPPRNDIMSQTLYNALLLMGNLVEMISKQTVDYTGGYCLHNFRGSLVENREALQDICVELAEEYKELVAAYCSVEMRLTVIFLSSACRSIKHHTQINEAADSILNLVEQVIFVAVVVVNVATAVHAVLSKRHALKTTLFMRIQFSVSVCTSIRPHVNVIFHVVVWNFHFFNESFQTSNSSEQLPICLLQLLQIGLIRTSQKRQHNAFTLLLSIFKVACVFILFSK